MAGRIRTIKPEILENKRTAGLSSDEFRLFIGCILQADDHGNLYAEPEKLHGVVFWKCPPARPVRDLLDTLASVSLLSLYEVRGQSYAHLIGWKEHQKVDKPSLPKVPGPENSDSHKNANLQDTRDSLATHSRLTRETLDTEGNSSSGKGIDLLPPLAREATPPPTAAPPLAQSPGAAMEALWCQRARAVQAGSLFGNLADLCASASLALTPAPEPLEYLRRWLDWWEKYRARCPDDRRPQYTVKKAIEHFDHVHRLLIGVETIAAGPPANGSGRRRGPDKVMSEVSAAKLAKEF